MTVNWIHPVIFKEEHYTNISVAEKQCCNDYGKLKDVVLWSEAQQTTSRCLDMFCCRNNEALLFCAMSCLEQKCNIVVRLCHASTCKTCGVTFKQLKFQVLNH